MQKNKSYLYSCDHKILMIFFFFCFISFAQAEDWIYEVREKDNLWNLTVDHLIDVSYVERVQRLNNIADPWQILPGTKIRIPSGWVRHYPAIVRVQNLQGTAQVLDDESDQPRKLMVGEIVMLGDTVITSDGSNLVLGFLDGSQILLQQNSRLKIDRLMLLENTGMSDSRFTLKAGRLETNVIPGKGSAHRFLIRTPVTVTSVRGTDYRVSSENEINTSKTEVVAGKVVVKGQLQSHLLMAGFGTVTIKDQPPKPPIKLLKAPDVSLIPKVFFQVPIQFSMSGSEQVEGYRVQIAKTEAFRDVLFDKPFFSSIIRGPDLADGNYYLRVRAIDKQQLEGYNSQKKITVNARPQAPFLVSPKLGAGILLEDFPEFIWSKQQESSQYHLQIAKDREFLDIIIDEPAVDVAELTVKNKMTLGKYFWRVAAIDEQGDGPFSDGQMFRRIVPAPELEAPNITDETLTIRSRRGLPGQSYHFQMSDDESFSGLLVDKYTDEPGFEIPNLGGGEYYIRTRTIDPDGFIGPFTAAQSIEVPYNLYWLLALLPLLVLLAL